MVNALKFSPTEQGQASLIDLCVVNLDDTFVSGGAECVRFLTSKGHVFYLSLESPMSSKSTTAVGD